MQGPRATGSHKLGTLARPLRPPPLLPTLKALDCVGWGGGALTGAESYHWGHKGIIRQTQGSALNSL